jgi:hypothetical protein
MVMAPEEPPGTESNLVPSGWRWLAIVLIVVLVVAGLVLWMVMDDDPSAGEGPGPVGPVGPAEVDTDAVIGSGTVVSETRDVGPFDAVIISGEGSVVVTKAEQSSVAVRTDDNLLPLVTTEVRGSTLFVDKLDGVEDLEPTAGIAVTVAGPATTELGISGAGSIAMDGLTGTDVELSLTGAGTILVTGVDASLLVVEGTGAGTIEVVGRAETQEVDVGGAVAYLAGDLESRVAFVESNSVDSAVVWVTDELDVVVRNVGSVGYYGSPTVTSRDEGLGSTTPLGDK